MAVNMEYLRCAMCMLMTMLEGEGIHSWEHGVGTSRPPKVLLYQ